MRSIQKSASDLDGLGIEQHQRQAWSLPSSVCGVVARRDSGRGREAGVTLPETLVALAILLVVAVAVLSLFSYAMKLNATGRHYTSLTRCARDSAEGLLALPWSDPRLSAGLHEGGVDNDENSIVWRVNETRVDASISTPLLASAFGEANLKEISITCIGGREAAIGRQDVTVVVLKARD